MGIERVILEHDAHPAVFGGDVGHVVLIKINPAIGGLQKAADQVQHRRFAAAGRAQQAHQLAVGHFEGEVVDGDDVRLVLGPVGEFLRQVIQGDFHGCTP